MIAIDTRKISIVDLVLYMGRNKAISSTYAPAEESIKITRAMKQTKILRIRFPALHKGEFNNMRIGRLIGESGKVTGKGMVIIPKEVRNTLKIEENDKIQFTLVGDDVVLRVVKSSKSLLDVFGSFTPNKPVVDVKDLRDQFRKELIADDLARQEK
ncbi:MULTISPECIES: AbrB/MazE/SpoVT family DNA-binding domain-containing protein [Paenibacillus]|uniref:SpoVT-AbrB domain-containing protein n=1 Tax=Paenibacillus borealis TaxID=160799 RepID=A0ABX3GW69_PAEBO|nr:AbrB/MazE/SpoVT family DNA-binding domain-containing protein [Paenibacillus borealis]OMD38074.1 hypothetical protein BSK56_30665 [Paenibacillus borealis]